MRQGCVMSPWLFNVFMDGCMREMKARIGNIGARLRSNGAEWPVVGCLFADLRGLEGNVRTGQGGGPSAVATPSGDTPGGNEASRAID